MHLGRLIGFSRHVRGAPSPAAASKHSPLGLQRAGPLRKCLAHLQQRLLPETMPIGHERVGDVSAMAIPIGRAWIRSYTEPESTRSTSSDAHQVVLRIAGSVQRGHTDTTKDPFPVDRQSVLVEPEGPAAQSW